MFFILTLGTSEQINLLQKAAQKQNTECRILDLTSEELCISLRDERISLGSHEVTEDDYFYSDINPEFPFIPPVSEEGNRRYLDDSYISRQQKMSQAFSLLSMISRKKQLLNNFEQLYTLFSQIDVLHRLEKTGLCIADYCITDNQSCFNRSQISENSELYWSSVEHQSPLKRIERAKITELLTAGNIQPYIFRRITPGVPVRIWLIRGRPVLAALITLPGGPKENVHLEQYQYIADLNFFKADSEIIHREFALDFVEIFGTVNPDSQQLVIYGLDPQPSFSELETTGKEWLAQRLVASMCGFPFSGGTPENGERPTVYLNKMLQPLIY
ncbi:MAG: hypothetical protein ACLFQB_13655 [Chitinispirillaceae bacterium]